MISTHEPTGARATVRRAPAPTPYALARAVVTAILAWNYRYRQRHALAELDDHLLRDIGLTRQQAEREARKPAWADIASDLGRAVANRRAGRS